VQKGSGELGIRDSSGQAIPGDWQVSADGRRWWLDIDPALTPGETYSLHLEGLEDRAGNKMATVHPIDQSFSAPAETAELDLPIGGEGDIEVVVDQNARLLLISGSPIDPASLANATITATRGDTQLSGTLSLYAPPSGSGGDIQGYENRILVWTPDDPGAYVPAEYSLTIMLSLADPAGHPIHAPPSGMSYTHQRQSDIVWSKPSQAPILTASQVGNDRYLHGRPYIQALGLYDYRARFYDPETSTFLEPDPLGPVDSPNLYQAFGFDGLNVRDPWGECLGINDMPCEEMAGKMIDALDRRIAQEPLPEGVKKVERLLGRVALTPVTGLLSIGGSEGRNLARAEGLIQGHQPEIRNEAELKQRIDQFGWDVVGTAGDVAVVAGMARALVAGSQALTRGEASMQSTADVLKSDAPTSVEVSTLPERTAVAGQESFLAVPRTKVWGPHNGPGPLGAKIASTFRSSTYRETILTEDVILYRVYGGRAGELGHYWNRVEPTGPLQAQLDSALLPEWGNTGSKVASIRVPAGTTIYEGAAAPQLGRGGIPSLLGGGAQVFIPRIDPAWLVTP
jgi:RHS repeat-associated protein